MKHRYIYIKADTIDPGTMVSVVPIGESLQDQRDFVYIQYQASHRSGLFFHVYDNSTLEFLQRLAGQICQVDIDDMSPADFGIFWQNFHLLHVRYVKPAAIRRALKAQPSPCANPFTLQNLSIEYQPLASIRV